ncbi:MAG: glycosyltransferase, partial [Prevotellaceae bacterium]|nr:glycosyltransferase [Prevotellaceae bacterium]
MIEILFIVLPLFLLLLSVGLNVYFRATAFKSVIACADAQSARVLPAPPVEGGVVGTAAAPLDPLVSIILPVQNEAETLSRHLPQFLTQRFGPYEVVVANAAGEDGAVVDVVTRFQAQHGHLRYTFVPESRRRNVDAHKVAVALGVRAARAPWVVVVEPDSRPTSDEWLQHLATHFTDENDVVMGYANYEHEEASAVPEANRLRAWDWARSARSVLAGHAAAADGGHVAFRREWFLQSGGFAGSL